MNLSESYRKRIAKLAGIANEQETSAPLEKTYEEQTKEFYPYAYVEKTYSNGGGYRILKNHDDGIFGIIGEGLTEEEAWKDAYESIGRQQQGFDMVNKEIEFAKKQGVDKNHIGSYYPYDKWK